MCKANWLVCSIMLSGIFGKKSDHPLADIKSAQALLDDLPKNDPHKMLMELSEWIESASDNTDFKLDHQFAVLLLLDETAQPYVRKLARDYFAPQELSKFQENRLWLVLGNLFRHTAKAYCAVFSRYCSGDKGAGAVKPHVPLLAARTVHSMTGRLKYICTHYGPIDKTIWENLAQIYRHGEQQQYLDMPINLYSGASGNTTVKRQIGHLLGWYGCGVDTLNPLCMHLTERIVAQHSSDIHIGAQQDENSLFSFDLDHPAAPMRVKVDDMRRCAQASGAGMPSPRLLPQSAGSASNVSEADGKQQGAPWLGMPVADINTRDRLLIVGSFLRKDHPLLAQRVRQAVKGGAQANIVHASDDDLLMPVANKAIVAPDAMAHQLAQILKALAAEKRVAPDASVQGVEAGSVAAAIARSLASGARAAVLLGNFAQQHPQATQIAVLAEKIAALCGASFGFLGEAANSVGGYLAGAVPFGGSKQGMNAAQMMASPRKAYLLLNVEPELDMHDSQQAMAAMYAADLVVALSAWKHHATDYADVLLPIAPFTETSGTFVSTEGRVQSFKGAVKPLGEARPAWKVLRVLGNLLELPGFDYDSSEAVREEALPGQDVAGKLNNRIEGAHVGPDLSGQGVRMNSHLQRVADVPIYSTDALVRRAITLQKTRDAATPCVTLRGSELQKLGVQPGDFVKVSQGKAMVRLAAQADDSLPAGVARVAAGHPATAGLGAMFGAITVEPIIEERA